MLTHEVETGTCQAGLVEALDAAVVAENPWWMRSSQR